MKLWNYIVIMTGVAILLSLGGVNVPAFSSLFSAIGLTTSNSVTPIQSFSLNNSFWNFIFGTGGILLLTISGILIGSFVLSRPQAYITLGLLTGFAVYWASVLVSIIGTIKGYIVWGAIAGVPLIALTVGFIWSSVEWFMGQD